MTDATPGPIAARTPGCALRWAARRCGGGTAMHRVEPLSPEPRAKSHPAGNRQRTADAPVTRSDDSAARDARHASVIRSPGRPVIPDDEVTAAVGRIERARALRNSTQLRRLLRYLIDNAQRGSDHALREIAVGVAALGRDPAVFDPQRDPIVRTEARRLRSKLAQYYETEGRDDPLVIELPKGGYLPVLRRRLPPGAVPEPVVAVLPFANFTGEASHEVFCDALTDEVIDALTRISSLRVIARTSAFCYKGTREGVPAIARALGAALVLEGSVQAAGERIRVIAQLVLGNTGWHVWSQAFEGRMAELDEIPVVLADEIVRAMERRGVLAGAGRGSPPPLRGTHDAVARELHDRALAILRSLDTARYEAACALLRNAIARDPRYARPHYLLAHALANRAAMCAAPASLVLPEALTHLTAALALEPGLAQARSLYAWLRGVWDRDWSGALAEIGRALRDAPGDASVRNTAGNLLVLFGRFDEAEAELALARELDPLHLVIRYNAALAALCAQRLDTAMERCDAILEIDPGHPVAAMRVIAQITAGQPEEGLATARRLVHEQPQQVMYVARLAEALAATGDVAGGVQVLADAAAAFTAANVTHWAHAHVFAVAGDRERAFAALELACAGRESNVEGAGVNPYFAPMLDDPRWPAFARRHQLPPRSPRGPDIPAIAADG